MCVLLLLLMILLMCSNVCIINVICVMCGIIINV